MEGVERRRVASEAAVEIAARYGLRDPEPLVLKDSNNTVVRLVPYDVVAKVGTTTLAGRAGGLAREVAILEFLAACGAPAVRPSRLVPAGPHDAAGVSLIFLDYAELVADEVPAPDRARALDAVHAALRRYPGALPGYLEQFTTMAAVLGDEAATPTLGRDDRALLLRAHRELLARVPRPTSHWQALHGDPWVGNMIVTAAGPLLVDFEAACRGPLEWDWSPLPARIAECSTAPLDLEVLELFRLLRSLSVSTWCWSQAGRAPEVDEAATWHLGVLRQALE